MERIGDFISGIRYRKETEVVTFQGKEITLENLSPVFTPEQALLGNPKVIILDEPTVGLDPIQIIEIRDLIRQLGESHTVILSSHILSEVQAICEKVLIIARGRLVAFDAPENLEKLRQSSNGIDFMVEALPDEVEEILNILEENRDEAENAEIETEDLLYEAEPEEWMEAYDNLCNLYKKALRQNKGLLLTF